MFEVDSISRCKYKGKVCYSEKMRPVLKSKEKNQVAFISFNSMLIYIEMFNLKCSASNITTRQDHPMGLCDLVLNWIDLILTNRNSHKS